MRGVLKLCNDCDSCRDLLNEVCVMFPEMFRIGDEEMKSGVPAAEAQLRDLVNLCNLCGLCPCPRIPADVMEAKSRYLEREGLPLTTRLLTDVPRMAGFCGSFPKLVDAMGSGTAIGGLIRKLIGIHADRRLPSFPRESFFAWAESQGLTKRQPDVPALAYFAGCTAGYLFPQVARSLVEILQRNGVAVYVPPQDCCGMPHLVEGNRSATLERTRTNLRHLLQAVAAGDTLVTSCPSCGYYTKLLLKDRAFYSEAYQRSVHADDDEIKVPDPKPGSDKQWVLKKSVFKDIMKDDGYFSPLDPLERIALAGHMFDAGEYLARLHAERRLDLRFGAVAERMVYFAPCHQRKQKIGSPYLELLRLIPEIGIETVGGELDCCGMGGNFGYKTKSHDKFLAIGEPLIEKIRRRAPAAIVTDCLSCRLQFSHALPYPVFHPLEILARAYGAAESGPAVPR